MLNERASETPSISSRSRLIVALDAPSFEANRAVVEALGDEAVFYKVGWRLFLQAGMDFVRELRAAGKEVFLDLKMDDIAETITTAVGTLGEEARFLTLQGSPATAAAAVRGRGDRARPELLFVTFLSSLDAGDLADMTGFSGPLSVEDYVRHRARRALEEGCEGLIASGETVAMLRQQFPKAVLVVPGIRPSGAPAGDQKRVLTPGAAIAAGADHLVVGRPIWGAEDPRAAAKAILAEVEAAG